MEVVNVQLAHVGSEFATAMSKPTGPSGAVVFGSVEGHGVRLDFFIEPVFDTCAVQLCDQSTKEVLAERTTARTFNEAINAYPWTAAIAALNLN